MPTFDDGYDGRTYAGRFWRFQSMTSPLQLFASRETIVRALAVARGDVAAASERQRVMAARLANASVHPDTGRVIPAALRMAAFVPANVLITIGLLVPNPSLKTLVFWQWANQTYMVALNHANRNASNAMSWQRVASAYAASVAASLGVALGGTSLVTRLQTSATSKAVASAARTAALAVPFVSVSTASALNVYLMRRNELRDGVLVTDDAGNELGHSRVAGATAVRQVATSRVVVCVPCLLLPPLAERAIHRRWALVRNNTTLHLPLSVSLITGCLLFALPAAIAIFPQRASLPVATLEPALQVRARAAGVDAVWFNKGL
eukprot:CAMPEP_0198352512 /NCGR_PEP_ID=MMETSP1450-20131203/107540_1 /TAXON_ID=753684 ORGANISM="Madagascaria erythrocladiodes, Strain CCMP3234" /NCGR_SAMPLE_ID=MMETSP1450 /ASSEMBLY_ACC=CAM_ASM_001115 /LENGTH=320 /DNA_ID=CAMNT_0044058547 /DNA_START=51 /DNA_END=1013 /DNA_ORIENTATION=-